MDYKKTLSEMPSIEYCGGKTSEKLRLEPFVWLFNNRETLHKALSIMSMVQSGEYKVVPVEPTSEMSDAGGKSEPFTTGGSVGWVIANTCYHSMIAASPDVVEK